MKRLALALETTRATRSRLGKERVLAEVLAAIARDPGDDDGLGLATAARLASGRTLPSGDPRPLGAGWALMSEVVVAATGFDVEVLRACAAKTGDLGEAFGLLAARVEGAEARPGVPLRELAAIFDALAASGNRVGKRRRLDALFAATTPLETKYIAKILGGSLRTGAMEGVLEGAIARAFAVDADALRRAWALVTDPGVVAVLARDGRLGEARLEPGRPVAFMLATPLETIASAIDPALHVVEDKIDGVRAQVHKVGPDVHLFARGLERVSGSFPEVVDTLRFVPGSFVLDGELVALGEGGRPRPFQALQARLRRVSPPADLVRDTPVTFVAYDLLADDTGPLLDRPWSERRARLEALASAHGDGRLHVHPVAALTVDAPLTAQIDQEFPAARARGQEGLVLKRIDAPYEAGRRGQAWIKVKRALATLDVVITAAEEGHGRRAGVLSDYTFGVWRRRARDDGANEGEAGDELVNVGKAYSGLTDEEIDAMTRRLERLTVARYGRVRAVKPEVVLEVAFDGLQRSTRHKSGFALRFPRIVRIREDKRPEQADRIEAVEALLAAQIDTGHREATAPEGASAPGAFARPKRAAKRGKPVAREQLGLFDALPPKPKG